MLAGYGIPAFVAYGVIIGEVIAPIMMILGIFTRLAALSAAATMVVAWLMVGVHHTFALSPSVHGRLKILFTTLWPLLSLRFTAVAVTR
jgi:uncharacterized membrane protein YphA (DoxX/SURF4 family)